MRLGILTVSDRSSRGERPDASGPALEQFAGRQGWQVIRTAIVPDEQPEIAAILMDWSDSGQMDLILTTGGTGFAPRDVTPEATSQIIDRSAPGLAEGMRAESLKITPHAMLSRGIAGIRARTLIINLPGSPKAAVENLAFIAGILQHAVDLITGDPSSENGHQNPRKDENHGGC